MPHYRSRTSTHGRNMAGARALWRATGMKDGDFGKPIIAVVNSFTQFVPGHVHLRDLGALVAGTRLKGELEGRTRKLLDALDKLYSFELPPTLVDQEFNSVWSQVEADMKSASKSFEDEGTTEEKAREEYRRIAERRVRLGLLLAEIGQKNDVTISDQEMTQAVLQQARQFPGQEKAFFEFIQQNPQAQQQLRAPIFEDKVVDHITAQAQVTEKTVTKEELEKALETLDEV